MAMVGIEGICITFLKKAQPLWYNSALSTGLLNIMHTAWSDIHPILIQTTPTVHLSFIAVPAGGCSPPLSQPSGSFQSSLQGRAQVQPQWLDTKNDARYLRRAGLNRVADLLVRHRSRSSRGSPNHNIDDESDQREEEGQEDERLVGKFQAAVANRRSISPARRLVIVLGSEDEGSEPEVREDEVQWEIPLLVRLDEGYERRGDPEAEDNRCDGDFIRQVQVVGIVVEEVAGDASDNGGRDPCHGVSASEKELGDGSRETHFDELLICWLAGRRFAIER
jgi:hypothetical protein